MTEDELEQVMVESFELGAIVGYNIHEKYGDSLSGAEVRARARNLFETKREELLNGG